MEPVRRAAEESAPLAVEFVRFCYRRRHIGWPELYDEMCAVAGRGLYRGLTHEDLAELGIGFSLSQTPSLAALVRRVVEEEDPRHRAGAVASVPHDRVNVEASSSDQGSEKFSIRLPVPSIA